MALRPTIEKIGKSTAIYGFGNVLVKFSAIILIPVYTRFLSLSEVGILALLEMVETFLVSLIPVAINNAVWRHLIGHKESDRKTVITTAYVGTVVLNLVLFGIFALNYQAPSQILGLHDSWELLFLLVILNIFLAFGGIFLLGLWQFDEKPIVYVLFSLGQFLAVLFLTIFFVMDKGYGLWGVLIARSLVYGILFVISGIIILHKNWSKPSLRLYGKLLKFGAPLMVLIIVTPVLSFSDRFFLNMFIPLSEIGIYSIAYRFGLLINMILVIPIQRSWGPMMYRLGIEEKSHQYYRDILFYYGVVGALLFLFISFFIENILRVIATPEYVSGAGVVPIIALAYFLNGFKLFFSAGATLKDKTPRLAGSGIIAIILNLMLNYVLIKNYGVFGAAWATLFSYLILVILIYRASQKLAVINWGWSRLIKLGLITVICYVVTVVMKSHLQSYDLFISLGGLILFFVLIRLTKIIGFREISGLKSLFELIRGR